MQGVDGARLEFERHAPNEAMPRHRHRVGYAALVLAGGYEEAGEGGRRHTQDGAVMLHGAFDSHQNQFSARGAHILNLPLPATFLATSLSGRSDRLDEVVRIARRDPVAAREILLGSFVVVAPPPPDWPDSLAEALAADPRLSISRWGADHALTPAAVSRGFKLAFGISPQAFRAQARARRAWVAVVSTGTSLADVAFECGFSDQSHLTRAVAQLTGQPPGAWRRGRANTFKTGS